MSFHVFFSFSTGLSEPITVSAGTKAGIIAHVESVETALGIKRTTFGEGEDAHLAWDHWDENYRRGFPDIDDKLLCETVETHNQWVRHFYWQLEEWAKTPLTEGETLTPDDAKEFWHGLTELKVEPSRWTSDYFRARMESLYEVMRGRESEGITFDAKPLTEKQAAAVIRIFDGFLDPGDLRLDVPDGHDFLASSYDGGYDWCDKCCKPKTYEDGTSCRKRKCPLAAEAHA